MNLSTDLARALDPSVLAADIGMRPELWQLGVFRSWHPRILMNCCRQSGKSTVASVLGVHAAVYEPGNPVLLISPTMRQSGELFEKCIAAYTALGRPVVAKAETALSLKLENGSRIISLPGNANTVRGYSAVRLVVVDEAAYTDDSLVEALLPMLAVSGGRLIALSTPAGKRGWFWEAWEHGGPEWLRFRTTIRDSQHIPLAAADEMRQLRGERAYRQEYLCEFLEQSGQAFGADQIAAAFDRGLQPLELHADPGVIDLDAEVS